ncbi:sugar O-acetyltransferase [Terriglobus roseus]|uniref:Nodulation protein L n=1 Tax=Terriglobus roseus TaxID=392734 RepID=A0A1H4PE15_9BACT|nr:sugar O-acetyltransferase [Terriglobus roseus]SEC05645.1 maltose O-acetyltransferase [Terriglobus roseus]
MFEPRPSAATEKQKMMAGDLYLANDAELMADRCWCQTQLLRLNATDHTAERVALLRILFGSFGAESEVRSGFACDYGYNIHMGRGVFLNFNCVLLDVMPIHIGDGTQIGPAVQIYAADHPRDQAVRLSGLECGKPVTVGRNCWIGGGAILLPGITVGDNAIIGAGSVVTHDVPAGATVAGNPARILRR